jgi:hypothetical protein
MVWILMMLEQWLLLGIAQKEIAEVQKQMTPACRRAADVDAAAQRVKMMRMLQK